MLFSVPTDSISPDRKANGIARVGRVWALLMLLALAACARQHPRPTPPRPAVKPPVAAPAAPTVTVIEPGNYDQDRARIKQNLARSERDSLPPTDIGYTMDVLQGRLRQVIGRALAVVRQGDRLVVDLSDQVAFTPGAVQIDPAGRQILDPLCRVLVEYRMTLVSISVRSEIVRNDPDPRALSLARFLIGAGVPSKRIVVLSPGASHLPVGSTVPGGRVRIELQIEPIVRGSEPKS